MLIVALTKIILAYSPRKNSAKVIDEYSVLKAADQFGFAFRQIERMAVGFREPRDEEHDEHREQNPEHEPAVALRLDNCRKFSEPTHSNTVMMTRPMETSYETICAAERNPPRNEYFEFDAQPATMMP